MKHLPLSLGIAALLFAGAAHAQTDSLRLYYVGRPVGWERYDVARHGDTTSWTADFSYIDRGRRIHLQSVAAMASDYAPRSLRVDRVTDTLRVQQAGVSVDGGEAMTTASNGQDVVLKIPAIRFALAPYQPLSQHLALIRYWNAHGHPATIALVPGGPADRVTVRQSGTAHVDVGGHSVALTEYSIDGEIWGREYAWLDASDRLAMFAAAGGGLSIKAIRAELLPAEAKLMDDRGRGSH